MYNTFNYPRTPLWNNAYLNKILKYVIYCAHCFIFLRFIDPSVFATVCDMEPREAK